METISHESYQAAPDIPGPQIFLQDFFELGGLEIGHMAAVVPAPALRGRAPKGGGGMKITAYVFADKSLFLNCQ